MSTKTSQVNALKLVEFLKVVCPEDSIEIATGKPDNRRVVSKDEAAQCFGRRNVWFQLHQVKEGHTGSVKGEHIERYRWFLLDFDADRASDTPSTNAEKQAAKEIARKVIEWGAQNGWAEPIKIDSGNGYQLLFPIDLPPTDQSDKTIKAALAFFAEKFGTPEVKVDQAVGKLSQLARMPWTINCKGGETPDRPHRPTTANLPEWAKRGERPTISLAQFAGVESHPQTVASAKVDVVTTDRLEEMLQRLPVEEYGDNESWFDILAACHSATAGEGLEAFLQWSLSDYRFRDQEQTIRRRWESLKNKPNSITIGTLFAELKRHGAEDLVRQVRLEMDFGRAENDPLCLKTSQGLTDTANALRLVRRFGAKIRFVPEWESWLRWDGRRWATDNGAVHVLTKASEIATGLWGELAGLLKGSSEKELKEARGFVRASNNSTKLRDMVFVAKTIPAVQAGLKQLNTDPLLLNCLNGTLCLSNGEFRPHQAEDLITQVANVNFDPKAECPLWCQQMELTFGGDADLIRYVQAVLGAALAGSSRDEILPIAWGDGANGKSTLWLTVKGLMGDYATVVPQDLLVPDRNQHPTIRATLYGCRFAAVEELEQGRTLKESAVKSLLEKKISCRRMGEDFWEFERTHTFWLSTNHRPQVRNADEGIWRRLKLIPFTRHIPTELAKRGQTQVEGFDEKLQGEWSGILNWLLEGYRLFRQFGLTKLEPAAVKTATEDYRADEDTLSEFITEHFVRQRGAEVRLDVVFDLLSDYSQDGCRNKRELKKELQRRGFNVEKSSRKDNRDRQVVLDLKLPTDGPQQEFSTVVSTLSAQDESELFAGID